MNLMAQSDKITSIDYKFRTPEYYLSTIAPNVLQSLNSEQLLELRRVIDSAIPKPAPKIVDLRFVVDLLFSRFYVVLFIGKDRRSQPRKHIPEKVTRIGNAIAATIIFISMNLTISAFLVLTGYLVKSAIGINLLPGHFPEIVKQLFS